MALEADPLDLAIIASIDASIDSYIQACSAVRRLSPLTTRVYRSDLKQIARLIGDNAASVLSLRSAAMQIIQNPRYSVKTIKRKLVSLHGFLRNVNEEAATNVFKTLRFKARSPKRLPKALRKEDLNVLLKGADEEEEMEAYLALLIMASTGLRVSEACAVKLGDVDIFKGEIKVYGKGAKERIVIVTNALALSTLRQRVTSKIDQDGPNGALLRNKRGARLTPQCFRLQLHKLAKSVGIDRRITPHMLRHSAATLLIEAGIDIRIVQRLLGHASISTTEIYTHVTDNTLRLALERADVIGGLLK